MRRDALANYAAEFQVHGLSIALQNAAGRGRKRAAGGAHKFALYQPRIKRRAGNVVEMRLNVFHQSLAGRQISPLEYCHDPRGQPGKNLFQGRRVQSVFALEVVVKQGLVDPGAARDLVGAGPGHALLRKLLQGGLEYGGPRLFGLSSGARPAGFGDSGHLINQLVRLPQPKGCTQI